MDGILIIDKEENYTSRDIVNIVGKNYHTKKVGHTGTLDPIATGVLVVCVNKATKLVEILTCLDKEYIATFEFGTLTDTLDNTGKVLKDEYCHIEKEELINTLNKMIGENKQIVPIYSAVKVNGKKLYEYARNNEDVKLPVHDVKIFGLELLEFHYKDNKTIAKIKCHVSKGTYIRSLGNSIASYFNTNAIMTSLRRTKQGKFLIENAISLDYLNENTKLISISKCLSNYYKKVANEHEKKYIKDGRCLENIYSEKEILFVNSDDDALALYVLDNNDNLLKPWKMFKI